MIYVVILMIMFIWISLAISDLSGGLAVVVAILMLMLGGLGWLIFTRGDVASTMILESMQEEPERRNKIKKLKEKTLQWFIDGATFPSRVVAMLHGVYLNALGAPIIKETELIEIKSGYLTAQPSYTDLLAATVPQKAIMKILDKDFDMPISTTLTDYIPLLACHFIMNAIPERVEPNTKSLKEYLQSEKMSEWKTAWFEKWLKRWKNFIPKEYRDEVKKLYKEETGRRAEEWGV